MCITVKASERLIQVFEKSVFVKLDWLHWAVIRFWQDGQEGREPEEEKKKKRLKKVYKKNEAENRYLDYKTQSLLLIISHLYIILFNIMI